MTNSRTSGHVMNHSWYISLVSGRKIVLLVSVVPTCLASSADWFNKDHAMCNHICVIINMINVTDHKIMALCSSGRLLFVPVQPAGAEQ